MSKAPQRWATLSRVLAASFGSYGVCSLAMSLLALLLSRSLGSPPAESVMTATLLGLVLCPLLVIAVFISRSAVRAWLGLGLSALLLTAAITLLGPPGM